MQAKIRTYIISIFIALSVGSLAAHFTKDGMQTLYATILTPPWAPPSALFPFVWTLLYALMGVSAAMIWMENKPENAPVRRRALIVYALSLAVNFSWCFVFFSFRSFGFAFVWLWVLIFLVAATIQYYRKLNPLAAYLQVPYLAWLFFAACLSGAIWQLNS